MDKDGVILITSFSILFATIAVFMIVISFSTSSQDLKYERELDFNNADCDQKLILLDKLNNQNNKFLVNQIREFKHVYTTECDVINNTKFNNIQEEIKVLKDIIIELQQEIYRLK